MSAGSRRAARRRPLRLSAPRRPRQATAAPTPTRAPSHTHGERASPSAARRAGGISCSACRWPLRLSAPRRPRQATPAAPLPHPLPGAAGLRPSSLLPHTLSRLLPFGRPPAVSSSSLPRTYGQCGPVQASTQPVRTPAGRRTARRPGLRGWGGGRDRGDVTNPKCVPHGPPAQEPRCRERSAHRSVRGCLGPRA